MPTMSDILESMLNALPAWLRARLAGLSRTLEVSLHFLALDYRMSDGSVADFLKSNWKLFTNGVLEEHPWAAAALTIVFTLFGWPAYKAARTGDEVK